MKEITFSKADAFKAIAELTAYIASLKDDIPYVITIKEHKKKRSKDANAYFWEFCGKLAAKTRIPREKIYRDLIKEIGDNHEMVCVQDKAVDSLIAGWGHNGLGWIAEKVPSKIKGCTNVILYYGSSTYSTEQMSRLIDLLLQECEQQDIDTTPLRELSLCQRA
jgi:hypothetical protein